MQEIDHSSSGRQLTVEQLLHLKRLEKPAPEFWSSFDRDLQQKQLKALVKPSLWARVRSVLFPRVAVWAPVSAAAGFAAVGFFALPFDADIDLGPPLAHVEEEEAGPVEMAAAAIPADTPSVETAPAVTPRTDAKFVVDALVPDQVAQGGFRTETLPQTFVASSETSAHYVVNAFTAGVPDHVAIPDAVLEF